MYQTSDYPILSGQNINVHKNFKKLELGRLCVSAARYKIYSPNLKHVTRQRYTACMTKNRYGTHNYFVILVYNKYYFLFLK